MVSRTSSTDRKGGGGAGAVERLDLSEMHFADELPEGRYIDLPGRGQAFVRVAAGPPGAPVLLLVHGLLATADLNWSLAIPRLAERYTVVAPDLRGHGRGLPTSCFTGAECAADLAALVEAMGLGRVIVVGYSLGGLVAQLFARTYPELTAGLVLCATASSFDVPTERGLLHLLEVVLRRAPAFVRRHVMMAILAPKERETLEARWVLSEVGRHDTMAILDAAAEAARFDSAPWLGSVCTPAAMVVTSADPVVDPARQRRLADLVDAEVFEIECDHSAPVKRPELFNLALTAACASVARMQDAGLGVLAAPAS